MGNPDLRSHLCFRPMNQERERKGVIVPKNRWIDNLTSQAARKALRPDGAAFHNDKEMALYVRCCSGHSRPVEIESIGRPLFPEQQDYQQQEPDYDLPSSTIHERTHPSRSNKQHADQGATQPKYRMRPAPESVEQERKIKPFHKKPITFMFHATYNDQMYNILEEGIQPGNSSTPRGRTHVHLASIDDVILDNEPSEAALTHVPGGRDALLILGFPRTTTKIGPQNILTLLRRSIPKDRKRRPTTGS